MLVSRWHECSRNTGRVQDMVGRASHRRPTTWLFSKCKEMLANNKFRERRTGQDNVWWYCNKYLNWRTSTPWSFTWIKKAFGRLRRRKSWELDSQIVRLAEFAQSHPQAGSVADTFGLRHRWTCFLTTLPNIKDLLKPLERAICDILIPSMVDHKCTELERDILSPRIYESHSECKCRVPSIC